MTLQKRPSKFFLRETKNMLKAFEKKKEETKPVRKDSHETFKVLKK